jgi:hypothetical protein
MIKSLYHIVSLAPAPDGRRHKLVVLLSWTDAQGRTRRKRIAFGHRDYRHNYSPAARANYLRRSAGIVDGDGNPTRDNPLSANYWSRRVLWASGEKFFDIQNPDIAQRQARVEAYRP